MYRARSGAHEFDALCGLGTVTTRLLNGLDSLALVSKRHKMNTLARNVVWGTAWGFALAALCLAYAALVALIGGSAALESYSFHLFEIVAIYFVAGIAGGIAAGLLRPMARSRGGATVMGALIGPLVYGAIAFGMGDAARI